MCDELSKKGVEEVNVKLTTYCGSREMPVSLPGTLSQELTKKLSYSLTVSLAHWLSFSFVLVSFALCLACSLSHLLIISHLLAVSLAHAQARSLKN